MLPELEINFRRTEDLSPEELAQSQEVEDLAFCGDALNDAKDREWEMPELHLLGKLKGRVVSVVDLIPRTITVSGKPVRVCGIGGVATHPQYQRNGYARTLLMEAERIMRGQADYEYGMLFCDSELIPYYNKSGYRVIENPIFALKKGVLEVLPYTCMVLELRGISFPKGEVDCQGLPW